MNQQEYRDAACAQTVRLSKNTDTPLCRAAARTARDGSCEVYFFAETPEICGVLLQSGTKRDKIIGFYFASLEKLGYVFEEQPRLKFFFAADF